MKDKIHGIVFIVVFSMIVWSFGNTLNVKADKEIKGVWATAYYCVYESEMDGTQTVTRIISGKSYTLKASFLFGGKGVAMQGTGRTGPSGDYIKYTGNGGSWAHIDNSSEFTDEVKKRYTDLGVTDFTGFGNLALTRPDTATYSKVSGVIGASGRELKAWYSIAVDSDETYRLFELGTTGTINFQTGTTPDGKTSMDFSADDYGSGFKKTKQIDIYVGEGEANLLKWQQTGDNRYVNIVVKETGGTNATGVGGIIVPVDKFALLAPYIGLTSTIIVATVATVIYVKRVKHRKEKQ
jgi:hypothetical protein